jgi:hypothetical protein
VEVGVSEQAIQIIEIIAAVAGIILSPLGIVLAIIAYAQYILPPKSELTTQLQENPSLPQNMQVVDATFKGCNEAYQWLQQIQNANEIKLDEHLLFPAIKHYETIFQNELRSADAAMERWEKLRKTRA